MSHCLRLPALAMATVLMLCACLAQPGPTLTAAATYDQAKAGALTLSDIRALIIIPPTLFSHGVAAPLQNMVLRAQTHMGRPWADL